MVLFCLFVLCINMLYDHIKTYMIHAYVGKSCHKQKPHDGMMKLACEKWNLEGQGEGGTTTFEEVE
jgi:hypothetical protein